MGRTTDEEMAAVLADLLKVVKLAMPADLFLVDPRVLRARELLASLRQVSKDRPPDVVASTSDNLLDLAFADTSLELLTVEPEARWDITLGIDQFMDSGLAPPGRQEAVEQIIREWLTANGFLDLPPEDPN